jgi:hypothetical protein
MSGMPSVRASVAEASEVGTPVTRSPGLHGLAEGVDEGRCGLAGPQTDDGARLHLGQRFTPQRRRFLVRHSDPPDAAPL